MNKKILKDAWEYPINDKHPLLTDILSAIIMPFYIVFDMIFELIYGEDFYFYARRKGWFE